MGRSGNADEHRADAGRAAGGLLRAAAARKPVPDLRSGDHDAGGRRPIQPPALREQHHSADPPRSRRPEAPRFLPPAEPAGHGRRPQQFLLCHEGARGLLRPPGPDRPLFQRQAPDVPALALRLLGGGQK